VAGVNGGRHLWWRRFRGSIKYTRLLSGELQRNRLPSVCLLMKEYTSACLIF